jgi:hypothetical protein
MLCSKAWYIDGPIFYICFDCKFVGQAGVGQVKEEEVDAIQEE